MYPGVQVNVAVVPLGKGPIVPPILYIICPFNGVANATHVAPESPIPLPTDVGTPPKPPRAKPFEEAPSDWHVPIEGDLKELNLKYRIFSNCAIPLSISAPVSNSALFFKENLKIFAFLTWNFLSKNRLKNSDLGGKIRENKVQD